jgi:hypothetical protein
MASEKSGHSYGTDTRREDAAPRDELVPETRGSEVIMGDGQLGGDMLAQQPDGRNPEGSMQLPVSEPDENPVHEAATHRPRLRGSSYR